MWIIALLVCVVTGALAMRKGYNFFLWALAGGVIGLIVLACLPFANDAKHLRVRGNVAGAVIAVLSLTVLAVSLTS